MDGFYKGELVKLIPSNIIECVANFLAQFWLPWYGKTFYKNKNSGDNVIPSYLKFLVILLFGQKAVLSQDKRGIHVFPFKTYIKKSIESDLKVLVLDYDSNENPAIVRKIVDELVQTDKGHFSGKAFVKDGKSKMPRLIALFGLEK